MRALRHQQPAPSSFLNANKKLLITLARYSRPPLQNGELRASTEHHNDQTASLRPVCCTSRTRLQPRPQKPCWCEASSPSDVRSLFPCMARSTLATDPLSWSRAVMPVQRQTWNPLEYRHQFGDRNSSLPIPFPRTSSRRRLKSVQGARGALVRLRYEAARILPSCLYSADPLQVDAPRDQHSPGASIAIAHCTLSWNLYCGRRSWYRRAPQEVHHRSARSRRPQNSVEGARRWPLRSTTP